jgi:hypothetical protein
LPGVVRNPAGLVEVGMSERWIAAGGDFFESIPAGGDAYVLKRILHDWSDSQCLRILRCCRAAMRARARLLVADAVVPAGNTPHPAKVMDMLMMVFAGGRERTEQEFEALFTQAGLRLQRITPTPGSLSLIEAIPA